MYMYKNGFTLVQHVRQTLDEKNQLLEVERNGYLKVE